MTTLIAALILAACQPAPPRDLGQAVADAMAGQPATFSPPDAVRREAVADAVRALVLDQTAAVPAGYERLRLVDAGGPLVGLVEVGAPHRGDGLYVVRDGSRTPVVVEAPHPRSDQNSEVVAAAVFTAARAEALLVAGTRRDAAARGSADAAHAESTAFAAVDRVLSVSGTTVVQVHGFSSTGHAGYPQVVLSDSTATPSTWLRALARVLAREGFTTCVFDGSVCRDLGATRNVEAAHARASGARFVHVELSDDLRRSSEACRRLSTALGRALRDLVVSGVV